MKTSWKAGLSVDRKKELEMEFSGSGFLRERLIKLLQDKIDSSTKESRLKITYESPNWSLLQADNVGYQRALEEVISLLK